MRNRWVKRAVLGSLLMLTTALGGCYIAPYGYYPRYAYRPVVIAPAPYGYYR